jgi:hypothetical protein
MDLREIGGDPLSPVFQFLFHLGEVAATTPGNCSFVLTLPTPSMASSTVGLGALKGVSQKMDFTARHGVESLSPGDLVTWLTSDQAALKCGEYRGLVGDLKGKPCFEIDTAGNKRMVEKFHEYHFARYYGSRFTKPRAISSNMEFLDAFSHGNGLSWATQSRSDLCFVGTPRLQNEMLAREFSIGGIPGCPDDVLRVENLFDARESPHFLSRFVKTMSPVIAEVTCDIAIFDGASAFQRHSTYVSSRSRIIVLDRWDLATTEVISKLLASRSRTKGTFFTPWSDSTPQGLECSAWRTA